MRTWLRTLAMLLLAPLAGALLYWGIACLLLLWPAKEEKPAEPPAVQAWVLSNGIHTDLVLPMRGHGIDWSLLFKPQDARRAPLDARYIAIGWGDRAIYLHTPRWSDLTVQRTVSAALGRNGALLHVTHLRDADLAFGAAHRLPLSQRQYEQLTAYVLATLPNGQARAVPGAHYAGNDAFYEAHGSAHIFRTCNNWTGEGLRAAGVTVSRWTPFDFTVTAYLAAGRP